MFFETIKDFTAGAARRVNAVALSRNGDFRVVN